MRCQEVNRENTLKSHSKKFSARGANFGSKRGIEKQLFSFAEDAPLHVTAKEAEQLSKTFITVNHMRESGVLSAKQMHVRVHG